MSAKSVYIGHIEVDATVLDKIRRKHHLTVAEVREALQWPARPDVRWEDHSEHGLRLVAVGQTATGRNLMAALRPVDETDGTWRLCTARAWA